MKRKTIKNSDALAAGRRNILWYTLGVFLAELSLTAAHFTSPKGWGRFTALLIFFLLTTFALIRMIKGIDFIMRYSLHPFRTMIGFVLAGFLLATFIYLPTHYILRAVLL